MFLKKGISAKQQIALLLILGAAVCLSPSSAHAGSGVLLNSTGAKEKGMAGAGLALPQDAVSAINNPASIFYVPDQISGGMTAVMVSPKMSATGAGVGAFPVEPGTFKGRSRVFPVPYFSIVDDLDNDKWSAAFSVYGFFGLGPSFRAFNRTNCPAIPGLSGTGLFCDGRTNIEFSAAFISPTLAYRLTPTLSVGVSPILAITQMKIQGFGAFAANSSNPNALSGNGTDKAFGYGGKVGIHYQGDRLSAGVTYQSEMHMQRWRKYAGLFTEGGNGDLPSVISAGLAYRITDALSAAFDVQHVLYSDVAAFSNDFQIPGLPGTQPLGTADASGFGWSDQATFHFGVQYALTDAFTVRTGYSYSTQQVPESGLFLDAAAPATTQHHFAAGFGYDLSETWTADFGASWTPRTWVRGPNPLSPDQRISASLEILELGLGVSYRF